MILDECRFRNWLATAKLPLDIQDTIEHLLDFEDCTKEVILLENKLKELESKAVLPPKPEPKLGKYIAQGNTYPVKDMLKAYGFRWNADLKCWYLTDLGKSTEETILKVRTCLKENDDPSIKGIEIIYVAANG